MKKECQEIEGEFTCGWCGNEGLTEGWETSLGCLCDRCLRAVESRGEKIKSSPWEPKSRKNPSKKKVKATIEIIIAEPGSDDTKRIAYYTESLPLMEVDVYDTIESAYGAAGEKLLEKVYSFSKDIKLSGSEELTAFISIPYTEGVWSVIYSYDGSQWAIDWSEFNDYEAANPSKKGAWRIIDWAGNVKFQDQKFDSFDDAEEFLSEKLGDEYDDERGEFDIVSVKQTREARYLDPKDPRSSIKSKNPSRTKLHPRLASYIETALWSSTDDQGEPLDAEYDWTDFAEGELDKAERDIDSFMNQANSFLPDDFYDEHDSETVIHDFWLTRNRHGAGFWDGDYEKSVGEKLTKLSHKFGEVDIYIGDDGKLYFSR